MTELHKGATVTWPWGLGVAKGKVREIHPGVVRQSVRGETVICEGTPEDPAVVVEQADGSEVVKLASELNVTG